MRDYFKVVVAMRVMLVMAWLAAAALPAAAQQNASTPGDRRGWFGISLASDNVVVQPGGRVAFDRPPLISYVEAGGPAYQAGLRSGDSIVSVEGLSITTPEGFERWAYARPGVPLRVGVRKQGQEREVTVVPVERASASTMAGFYSERLRLAQRRGLDALRSAYRAPIGWLGIGLECEQCSVTSFGRRQQAWTFRQPPAVLTVDVEGPANRAGLRRGDTLTAIDGVDLTTAEGGRAFAQIEPGQRVTLTVRRAGRERRVPLVAVARPDASREEMAAFEEYRRLRDSADASYRGQIAEAVARAQAEMREAERQLRDLQLSRGSVDSTRRRLAAIDSVLRVLRAAERERSRSEGFAFSYVTPVPPVPPVAVAVPSVPTPPAMAATAAARAAAFPLRYSGRLGEVVNVEARAPGSVVVSELADSAVVVSVGSTVVTITLRCVVPAAQVRVVGDSVLVGGLGDAACRRVIVPKSF